MKKRYKKGENIQLSKSFHLREFECQCKNADCVWVIVDTDHIEKLQQKRDKWGKPIKINSAHRCEKHNKAVGGATGSRHVQGDATDITVSGMTPIQVSADCEDFKGKGLYDTFVHVDSRDGKSARWDFRTKK